MDNCEQVLAGCADVAKALLTIAPKVKVLATSREPLHISGEFVLQIQPLNLDDGAKLFHERARQTSSDITISKAMESTIGEIVKRLDGLPLAIELAAARMAIMNPDEILSGLDERFTLLTGGEREGAKHHESLRASIDWSYDLMEPAEQDLVQRLSVLRGFTLEAARLFGTEGMAHKDNILDRLQRLVNMSMVQVDRSGKDTRYRFLESVRHFLLQKLEEAGALAAARTLHLTHFIDFAEARAQRLVFDDGPVLLSQIQTEFDNLEDALTYADSLDDPSQILRLLTALSAYYELRGQFQHGIRWFDRALAAENGPDLLTARALWGASHVCAYGGRMDLAFPKIEKAIELAREIGDTWTEARALEIMGFAQSVSQPDLARETLLKCIELGQASKDDWAEAHGKKMFTAVFMFSHDQDGVKQALADLKASSRQHNSRYLLAWAEALTGYFARDRGDFSVAEQALLGSIENSDHVGDPATGGFAMAWSSALKANLGQVDEARQELLNLMASASVTGTFLAVPEAMFQLGLIEVADGNPETALQMIGAHIDGLRAAGILAWSEQLVVVSAAANVALGKYNEAKNLLDEVNQFAASLNNPLINGLSHFVRGRLALAQGDAGKAEAELHEALTIQQDAGLKPTLLRTLESIAEILIEKEKFGDAARVLAIVDDERAEMPLVRGIAEKLEHRALLDRLEQALGADTCAQIKVDMKTSDLDSVLELVSRMRGTRARPLTGWASLTPTERRVVSFMGEGLSNPQIAEKMFIARGTVKIHVSHIFEKMDVKSRTQLVVKAVEDDFER
ncbi:LuxR C-terminal-related transcriptional regulator [Alphaproteobacteria bacterium]|nr:LuxR C-terminal-related transcriptional regulator [Alphaproteobacteria bacterium]